MVKRYTDELILTLCELSLSMPGFHNMENAVAAAFMALELGLKREDVESGVASFKGVRRRFEYYIQRPDMVLIDDYAHHPTEIKALLESVKALYPDRYITCIFQPHLFSRTRDFLVGFAESLSLADNLILMDIYPAREKPIPGITSERILELVSSNTKVLLNSNDIPAYLKQLKPNLVLTVGAGNVDVMPSLLKDIL